MTKRLVFLLAVLLFSANLFGQLYEVGFDEKIRNSSFIVEGEVVKSESYYGKDNEIYTANELLVYKTFKGNNVPERLTIITLGGTVGSETETWTHLLKLSTGDKGIFFLEETKRPIPTQLSFPQHYFNVFASSQGFLKYHFEDGQVSAAAPFAYYPNIVGGLYKSLRQELGIPAIYLSPEWEKAEKCIVYLFEVSHPDPRSPLELEALVSIKSTQGQFYLYKSSVIAEFNSDALGESIIENEILEIENTGITDSEGYSVNAADVTPSKIKIEVVSNTSEVDEMALIGEGYSALVKLKLNLPGLVDPGILLDESQMVHSSEYFDPESEKPEEFECIKIEGDFDIKEVCSPPVITSFTTSYLPPDTVRAGTQDTLTIRGMCFDTIRGTSEVEFTDAISGPIPVNWVAPLDGDYVLWSDTLIKVLVPSFTKTGISNSAGTGRFRVNRGASGIGASATDLFIPFAALNHTTGAFAPPPNTANKSLRIHLGNVNGMGGLSIYYASNFAADTNAVKAFERALENWRCTTFINYRIQDSTTISDINQAGRIEYAPLPVGAVTTLASTDNSPLLFCIDSTGFREGARRLRFKIQFNSKLSWHTDTLMPVPLPANTFDLESRAAHELGHAHLLNHSNNINDLMYFTDSVAPFEYRRDIVANDEQGGDYIVEISANSPSSCPESMAPLTPTNCEGTTSIIELDNRESFYVEVFPNPVNDEFQILVKNLGSISNVRLDAHLFDVIGRQVVHKPINENTTVFNISALPPGIYFFIISHNGEFVRSFKITKN